MANTIDYFFGKLHAKRGQQALKLQPFHDFVLRVINNLDTSPESFWRCRDALANLTMSRGALDYIEGELLSGLTLAHYLPQFVLLECDRFSLHLRFLSPSPASTTISASVEHRLIAMVHGSAQLYRFEQPKAEPLDVFDRERKLVSLGVSALNAGDVMECRAAVDCYELSVDDAAIIFEMRSEPVYNFQWLYDSATLAPKRIVFVDSQDMRAGLGLLTALNLRSSDSVPYVRSFLGHPNHFIRWSALKAMVHLEPEKAAAHLDAAVHDCHPQVRAAVVQLKLQVDSAGEGVAIGTDVAH
jgi:HEAT repeats